MAGSERGAGCETGGGGSGAGADGGAAEVLGSAGGAEPTKGVPLRAAGGGGAVANSLWGLRFCPESRSNAGSTRPSGKRRANTLANRGRPLVKYQIRA